MNLTGRPPDVPSAKDSDPPAPRAECQAVFGFPEHSHPGKSAPNGIADAAAKSIVNQARTLNVVLEYRLRRDRPLPCTHPVVAWLFEHAAWILSKVAVNHEGRTPWA